MNCKFCNRDRTLVKTHIIPEALLAVIRQVEIVEAGEEIKKH